MTQPVTKTAVDPDCAILASRFYNSAREGMSDVLAALGVGTGSAVLLPAFIGYSAREGSGVHDPVRLSGARSVFYPVDERLDPDIAEIGRLIADPAVRVLIVIHYYGRTARGLDALRALADAHDVVLVEDLAHGFFTALGRGPAGRAGEVQLLSLHKMLPTPDGGMIRIRDVEVARQCRSTRPDLAQFVLDYDWELIARRRRARFEELVGILRRSDALGNSFALPWTELDDSDVPQTLPVRVLDGSRDAVYEKMNAEGFGVVSLYHTLIDEVRADHPVAVELSRQITNLPVHQDVDPASIRPMAELFLRALGTSESENL